MLNEILNLLIDNIVMFIIMIGMIVVLFTTKNHFPKNVSKYIVLTFSAIFVYSFVAAIEKYLSTIIDNPSFAVVMLRRITSFIGYSLRPLIVEFAILIIYDMSKKRKFLFSIGIIVNALVHVTGLWTNLAFIIDRNNIFHRGPLGFFSFVVIALYCLFGFYVVTLDFIKGKKQEGIMVLFILLSSITCGILDVISESTQNYLGNGLCVAVMFYYLFLNVEYARRYEIELVKLQKNELMLSQVKPHFMYNVLTTIYYLVDHDSVKAKKAVNDFSLYLRCNLDTMNKEQIIDFNNEVKYINYYLALEKVRFDDELEFDMDFEITDFKIPKFTLQPIVENAVKHGVSQKIGGGHVHIYTKDEGYRIKVGVIDDGVGFDINQPKDDGRSHVGIKNISYRLNEFLSEELHIESKINEGTHTYFYVPKKFNYK